MCTVEEKTKKKKKEARLCRKCRNLAFFFLFLFFFSVSSFFSGAALRTVSKEKKKKNALSKVAFKDENEQRSEPGEGGGERHALNCRGSPLQSSNQSITVFNCMKIVTSSRNRVYTCKIKAPHRRNVKAIPQSPKAPVPQQHREKKKGKIRISASP